jgi:hypothetical protein
MEESNLYSLSLLVAGAGVEPAMKRLMRPPSLPRLLHPPYYQMPVAGFEPATFSF